MGTEFIEDIQKIRVINVDNLQNIVCVVQYVIECHHMGKTLQNMFDVELKKPDQNNFIDFNSLTKEKVLSWVKDSIGESSLEDRKQAMKTMIEQLIEADKDKPKDITPPWNTGVTN